jgi:hypothetical protein
MLLLFPDRRIISGISLTGKNGKGVIPLYQSALANYFIDTSRMGGNDSENGGREAGVSVS